MAVSSRLLWWRQDEEIQNFGDALSPLLQASLAAEPFEGTKVVRLVGSVISNFLLRADLGDDVSDRSVTVTYWGCGMRDDRPLKPALRRHLRCQAVRGPLTRDALGLPAATPIGDPGLLLPLIHQPPIVARHAGRSVCVPHFHEQRPDCDLQALTGAEQILRPNIAGHERCLLDMIETIATADFVLAGALHAAVVASAYRVPFAYLDTGSVNIPFKWLDFSASLDIPTVFARNLAEGRAAWRELLCKCITLPPVTPLLAAFPARVRPEMLQRAIRYDEAMSAMMKTDEA